MVKIMVDGAKDSTGACFVRGRNGSHRRPLQPSFKHTASIDESILGLFPSECVLADGAPKSGCPRGSLPPKHYKMGGFF